MGLRSRWTLLNVCAFALAAIILSPQLFSGYIGDDVHNSLSVRAAYGPSGVLGPSVAERTVDDIRHWIGKGRFYPLASYAWLLFYALDGNLLAYKLLILSMTLINLWQFRSLVRRLTGSDAMSLLAVVAVPLFLQMRTNDDPLVSYQALVQVTTMWTLASLLAFTRYLDEGGRRHLAVSVLTYLAALLTYEISLPFFLFHFIIAWLYPKKRRIPDAFARSWPFALSAFAIAGITVALRLNVGKPLAGGSTGMTYVPNFDPGTVLLTLAKQLSAALPLTFGAGSIVMKTEYVEVLRHTLVPSLITAVPLAVVAFGIVLYALRQLNDDHNAAERAGRMRADSTRLLLWLGLAVLVLPDVLTSLSPVYQDALQWGLGHLGVYVSCYGSALILLAAVGALAARGETVRTSLLVVMAVSFAAIAGLNHIGNRTTVELVNQRWRYPSELVQRSLDAGVLDDVPDGSILFLPDGRFWDTDEYYALFAQRNIQAVVGWSALSEVLPATRVYVLDYSVPVTTGGWVTLAQATASVDSTSAITMRPLLEYHERAVGSSAAGPAKEPLWTLRTDTADRQAVAPATVRDTVTVRPVSTGP